MGAHGSVVTIIPSIGSPLLADALESLARQDFPDLDVYLVIDGEDRLQRVKDVLAAYASSKDAIATAILAKVHSTTLSWNVGAGGFFGHRIYAAFPHLVDHPFITFLDEDNWYLPHHIRSLVETLEYYPAADFAHSLRAIYRPDGAFFANDDCESLGEWPSLYASGGKEITEARLVDTSSYMFRRDFLTRVCQIWHYGWGSDRRFFTTMRHYKYKFAGSGEYTLAYRLGGNPKSVPEDYFVAGNRLMHARWKGNLPWTERRCYPD